jgi:hypothetical protein
VAGTFIVNLNGLASVALFKGAQHGPLILASTTRKVRMTANPSAPELNRLSGIDSLRMPPCGYRARHRVQNSICVRWTPTCALPIDEHKLVTRNATKIPGSKVTVHRLPMRSQPRFAREILQRDVNIFDNWIKKCVARDRV